MHTSKGYIVVTDCEVTKCSDPASTLQLCPHSVTSKFQSSELKGHKAIAVLYDVYESIESIRGEDEEVTTGHLPPASEHQVTTQVFLEYPGEVLVKQAVQSVGVGVWGDGGRGGRRGEGRRDGREGGTEGGREEGREDVIIM